MCSKHLEQRRLLSTNSLVVSEVMYNGVADDGDRAAGYKDRDFEFIELLNNGDTSLNLSGFALRDAIDFVFGQTTVAPGQYVLVVRNQEAFESRYGTGPLVAGQYDGSLGNGGDRVVLTGTMAGNVIEDFTYDDKWYPTTDGDGNSLTIATSGLTADKSSKFAWKASELLGGSPGYGDGSETPGPKELTAIAYSSRRVALEWIPGSEGETLDYRIYRNDQLIGTTNEASFVDDGAAPGATFTYQVGSVGEDGTEYGSSPISVRVESVGGDLLFGEGVSLGVVQLDLTELSGLAASRINEGVLWTISDGPQTAVEAISTTGASLGSFELQGFSTRDWEDIAIGPGPEDGVDYLYIADIGADPKLNVVQVYRAREPIVSIDDAATVRQLSDVTAIQLKYPESAKFNAEALLSDPLTGDLYIVTKQRDSAPVYRAAAADLLANAVVQLQRVAQVSLENVSGGDISPNGREILIRNEDFAVLYSRGPDQSIGDTFATEPTPVRVVGRPTEPNGEAITFGSQGRSYLTVSEGASPLLYSFERILPASAGDANRDGLFLSSDLVEVFQSGKYESGESAAWDEGDWTGDGVFDSADLVAAFQVGRYEAQQSSIMAAAVADMIFGDSLNNSRDKRDRSGRP